MVFCTFVVISLLGRSFCLVWLLDCFSSCSVFPSLRWHCSSSRLEDLTSSCGPGSSCSSHLWYVYLFLAAFLKFEVSSLSYCRQTAWHWLSRLTCSKQWWTHSVITITVKLSWQHQGRSTYHGKKSEKNQLVQSIGQTWANYSCNCNSVVINYISASNYNCSWLNCFPIAGCRWGVGLGKVKTSVGWVGSGWVKKVSIWLGFKKWTHLQLCR